MEEIKTVTQACEFLRPPGATSEIVREIVLRSVKLGMTLAADIAWKELRRARIDDEISDEEETYRLIIKARDT